MQTNFDLESLKARSLELAESHCGIAFDRARKALCPAHADRTPSLSYWAKAQRFHCFPCGFDADIVGLYRKVTGTGFLDAAKALGATATGVRRTRHRAAQDERETLARRERRLWQTSASERDSAQRIADDESRSIETRIAALGDVHDLNVVLDTMLEKGATR